MSTDERTREVELREALEQACKLICPLCKEGSRMLLHDRSLGFMHRSEPSGELIRCLADGPRRAALAAPPLTGAIDACTSCGGTGKATTPANFTSDCPDCKQEIAAPVREAVPQDAGDPIGCKCSEFPECTHALYFYMGVKHASRLNSAQAPAVHPEAQVMERARVLIEAEIVTPVNEHGRVEVLCDTDEQFYVNADKVHPLAFVTRECAAARMAALEQAAQHRPIAYQSAGQTWIECSCGWNMDGTEIKGVIPDLTNETSKWSAHIRALAAGKEQVNG